MLRKAERAGAEAVVRPAEVVGVVAVAGVVVVAAVEAADPAAEVSRPPESSPLYITCPPRVEKYVQMESPFARFGEFPAILFER